MGLDSSVIIRFESVETHDMLVPQIRDSSKLEGHVPVFIYLKNRVTLLYPQALGSLFVSSYDSQGYSGSIRTHLHTGSSLVSAGLGS
jgi:hypothetical protein